MKIRFILTLVVICSLAGTSLPAGCPGNQNGYQITLEMINHKAGEYIFLRQYRGKTLVTLDSLKSGSSGKVVFTGPSPLSAGMYAIVLNPAIKTDFFISDGENRNFSINMDVKNPVTSVACKNSRENQVFADFRRYMESIRYQTPGQDIQDKMMSELTDFGRTAPNSMLALFLRSIRDPEIPDPRISGLLRDREQRLREYYYRYQVNHFFDNIDFSDIRILRMPVLEEKTDIYFRQIVKPVPDTLQDKAGKFLEKTKACNEVYNWSVRYLYNHFRESAFQGSSGVCNFIAEHYILTEPKRWNDAGFVARVRERNFRAKLNAVGRPVTDLELKTPEGLTKSLYTVAAPLIILYFFNPGCESCLPVTTDLYKLYKQYQSKGVQVYAVYPDRNKEEWLSYISAKKLDWINVYDPDGSRHIEQKYDIFAIPLIYLLDRDKKVLKKDITIQDLGIYLSRAEILR